VEFRRGRARMCSPLPPLITFGSALRQDKQISSNTKWPNQNLKHSRSNALCLSDCSRPLTLGVSDHDDRAFGFRHAAFAFNANGECFDLGDGLIGFELDAGDSVGV